MASITIEYFTNGFFQLNAIGNPKECFSYIADLCKTGVKDDGSQITYEWLEEKYKEYLEYWNVTFGSRDQKYVGNKDKKMSIYDFLYNAKYKESFVIALNHFQDRDPYLFGDDDLKTLSLKVIKFKNQIKANICKNHQESP